MDVWLVVVNVGNNNELETYVDEELIPKAVAGERLDDPLPTTNKSVVLETLYVPIATCPTPFAIVPIPAAKED
jgi:hypothetical protein